MGAPNNRLIPAAVLLDNPGLSADEFVQALDETRSADSYSCDVRRSWDDFGGDRFEDDRYHRGLFVLADILRLKEPQNGRYVRNGHIKEPLPFEIRPQKRKEMWRPPSYRFRTHISDLLGPKIVWKDRVFFQEPKPGLEIPDITGMFEEKKYRIAAVLHQKPLVMHLDKNCKDLTPFKATVIVQECIPVHKEENYDSLPDMIAAHPESDPRTLYDFSQKNGLFPYAFSVGAPWLQKEGKYYLNTDQILKENKEKKELLYTSIILTAEAIRLKAWNAVCYDGARNEQRFLADFPEARERYERAVLHFWLSQYSATCKSLSNQDFLRFLVDIRTNASPPLDAELELNRLIDLVEHEGFGFGRYLRVTLNDPQQSFTDEQRARILAGLKSGLTMSECLRADLQERQKEYKPVPRPVVVDDVPF